MNRTSTLDYPAANIRMLQSTPIEAGYRLKACAKEPWTVAWLDSMPAGSVLYDVGANVGSYSLVAAARGIQVVAIEPAFANFARLCENILLNDFGHLITPLCLAVGNRGGACAVLLQEDQPGYSGGSKRLQVPVLPLVGLPAIFGVPPPTHIKIDVDGAELPVLQGMGFPQSLMVEHAMRWRKDALIYDGADTAQFLADRGYVLQARNNGQGDHPHGWYGRWERG